MLQFSPFIKLDFGRTPLCVLCNRNPLVRTTEKQHHIRTGTAYAVLCCTT